MLHLPQPHICPECGGPHRPTRTELPAASELRPYFGTYTPSKFPPAAAAMSAAPYAVDTNMTNVSNILRGVWTTAGGSWAATRAGLWDLYCQCVNSAANANDSIDFAQMRFLVGGNPAGADGPSGHRYSVDTPSMHAHFVTASLNLGSVVQVQVIHSANGAGTTATFSGIVLKARFVPTTANPQ